MVIVDNMSNKKNKFKIVTYIDRINVISEIFIKYYLNFFNLDEFHFLILDTEYKKIHTYLLNKNFSDKNFQTISNKHYGIPKILGTQNQVSNTFVEQGYIVVYVDIDEIIYHHDLRNYINSNIDDYITPSGIVLMPNSNEGHLNHNDKILNQRKYCLFDNLWYSKTCILNKKYQWSGGRHNKNLNRISDDIFLIDIGKCCSKLILENNKKTNEIYDNVITKYSTENELEIEKMISQHRHSLKQLPEYVISKKLF